MKYFCFGSNIVVDNNLHTLLRDAVVSLDNIQKNGSKEKSSKESSKEESSKKEGC